MAKRLRREVMPKGTLRPTTPPRAIGHDRCHNGSTTGLFPYPCRGLMSTRVKFPSMKPRTRAHVDGIGDGLSMALGIIENATDLKQARDRVIAELRRARAAKNRDNCRLLEHLIDDVP